MLSLALLESGCSLEGSDMCARAEQDKKRQKKSFVRWMRQDFTEFKTSCPIDLTGRKR